MAYVTGSANSVNDLLTAIQAACTANGWTLSGNVLHKGTCFADVSISGGIIKLQSGTGVDGTPALTGRSTNPAAYVGMPIYFATQMNFAYPCVYDIFIHAAPDEVYVHVTFALNCHQQLGWGLSNMSGLAGSGNWYAGGSNYGGSYGYTGGGYRNGHQAGPEVILNGPSQAVALFASTVAVSCGVDHALDGPSWNAGFGTRDAESVYSRMPNQWDAESILMPVRVYAGRPSGFISPVLECAHLRYVSMANLDDGQILTLGADKWMVFPYARRGGDSGAPGTGSQWCGHAFRYDGP